MRKIATLMLFALSISLTNAQNERESSVLEKLNLKSIESVFDERGKKVDRETGALRVNRNEYFVSETATDASEIALHYLQEKADIYGLSSNPDDIKVAKVVESAAGKYVYCKQYVNDILVDKTNFIVYIDNEDVVRYALNEFRNIDESKAVTTKSSVKESEALNMAYEYLDIKRNIIGEPKTQLVYFESIDNGLELAWKINVASISASWQIFVSAASGRIIHAQDIAMYATGSGDVFIPNPLVSANKSYEDTCSIDTCCFSHNNGQTNACLNDQLIRVTLHDITVENGVYKLEGPYCVIKAFLGNGTYESLDSTFHYTRDEIMFRAVMCYYHIDLSARRILQLGYNIPGLDTLKVDPHFVPIGDPQGIQAKYLSGENFIIVGGRRGNVVHSAEDADVIWHEYGHAIQWNLPGGVDISDVGETKALMEGSADYWAASYKRSLYPDNWAEMGLWYHMNATANMCELNRDWQYPSQLVTVINKYGVPP